MGEWAGQEGGAMIMLAHCVEKNKSPFKVFVQNVSWYYLSKYIIEKCLQNDVLKSIGKKY